MKLEYVIEKANITNAECARILNKTPGTITNRIKAGSEILVSEMMAIEDAIGRSLYRDIRQKIDKDRDYDLITIPYLYIEGFDTEQFKVPMIQERIQFDREIIENYWNRVPENLRWFPMLGNTMNEGEYPLNNNDVLIVDITSTDSLKSGMYVYTTIGGIFINGISTLKNGKIQFIFKNSNYPSEIYSPDELKNMKFKIIGRVVKNLSLTK